MATAYEVRMTVTDKGRADPPVSAVLERSLADGGRVEVSQEPPAGGQGGERVRVHLWVDANDSSQAQIEALDRVRDALSAAGLRGPAVELGDPDVRASS
jgi:hypothetical protein